MCKRKLPSFIYRTIVAASLLLATLWTGIVQAQTYYFPGSNYSYTGGTNVFPWAQGPTSSNKCQWLYLASDFNTTPPTSLITTIYFKPGASVSGSYSGLQISMMNTTMTTLGTGAVTWYTGLTTVYAPTTFTITTTANSWYAITLPTPFFYTGGNILLEITHNTTSPPSLSINQFSVTGRTGRMYGIASNTASTGSDAATSLFGFDVIPASCSGTPLAPLITSAAASPASPVCAGNTTGISASDPNAPIANITYQWQSSAASTGPFTNVVTGSGATTLNYTTGPLAATTWFRMGATCTNSSITSYSAPYQVLVGAPQPGPITGRASFCPADTANYYVTNVPGTTYTWTLPATWSGYSTTNNILTTMGTAGGTVSVTATSSCGTSIPRTYAVVNGSSPAAPASVTGPTAICPGTPQTYSVGAVSGATSYIWTHPGGWTGTSSTPTINVVTDTSSGPVTVKTANGCGTSAPTSLTVNVLNNLATPGPITTSATGGLYCSGALYTFSIPSVLGATSYQWTLPTGWSGTISGTSIQAFAGAASGQVKVTALVSCATSATTSLTANVTPTVTPSVAVSSSATNFCQGVPTTFTATPANGGTAPFYQWQKNNVNVIGSGNSYSDASLVNGDVIAVLMTSNALCRSADTIRSANIVAAVTPSVTPGISINSTPVVTICAGSMLNFSTVSTGGGSSPLYQWYRNGVAIGTATGTYYSTSAAANGDTFTVKMTTNAVCATMAQASSNKVGVVVNAVVNPSITIAASSTVPVTGVPLTFTATQSGGGPTPVYQWMKNGVDIAGETAATFTSSTLVGGDHITVRMQSYDPCAQPAVVYSNEVVMDATTGIAGVGASSWEGAVSLYPNPAEGGRFTVAAVWAAGRATQQVTLQVLNAVGQLIYRQTIKANGGASSNTALSSAQWKHTIELPAGTPAGPYLLHLSDNFNHSANIKFSVK